MRVEGFTEADKEFLETWDICHGNLEETAHMMDLSKETVRKKAAHMKSCFKEARRIVNTMIRKKWVKEIMLD